MFKDKGLNPTSNCLQISAHTKTRFGPLNTHTPHSCGLTSLGLYLLILPLPPPVFSWPKAKPCHPHYCILLLTCCPDQSPIRYASPSPLPTSSLVLLRSQWDTLTHSRFHATATLTFLKHTLLSASLYPTKLLASCYLVSNSISWHPSLPSLYPSNHVSSTTLAYIGCSKEMWHGPHLLPSLSICVVVLSIPYCTNAGYSPLVIRNTVSYSSKT